MGRKPKVAPGVGARIFSLYEHVETQAGFAKRLGFSTSVVAHYVRGERQPSSEFLEALAVEGIDVNWLLTGENPGRIFSDEFLRSMEEEKTRQKKREAEFEGDLSRSMKMLNLAQRAAADTFEQERVAVLDTDVGSLAGSMLLLKAVCHVERPDGLKTSPQAYGLFIRGRSMAPRYRDGDLIFVDPRFPPVPGNEVIIQVRGLDGDIIVYIKEYMRTTGGTITTRQLGGPAGEVKFPEKKVVALHKVVSMKELFGL